MEQATFNRLLAATARSGASDLHLKVGAPPAVRIHGVLTPVRVPSLAAEDMDRIAGYLLAAPGPVSPSSGPQEKDGSYVVEGAARYRLNLYRQKGSWAASLRVIRAEIPTFAELGLPPVVERIANEERGLVVVTGRTGSGKTSTLAAIVGHVNRTSRKHILTIEDPIEYVHEDALARISQREVGTDTGSFSAALRSGLRQNPDVLLVGEMRDYETIDIALKAAETGLLVLATLHTSDAAQTIGRVVGAFPTEAQAVARLRLADALRATISQRLVPAASGTGRVLAAEVLVSTFSVQTMIKSPEKMDQLRDYLESGRSDLGTQTFDQHLLELYQEGRITLEVALASATNPSDIQRAVDLG